MRRIESFGDEMMGRVTYELAPGKWVQFDVRDLREHGLANLLRYEGLEQYIPTERLPVIRNGRRIGTMPPDFDPAAIKSLSFLYDPRPGDFRREGDTWVVDRTMGGGDVDCVVGFIREAEG